MNELKKLFDKFEALVVEVATLEQQVSMKKEMVAKQLPKKETSTRLAEEIKTALV